MRILVTVPWGSRLGGSEGMLHSALSGAGAAGHELDLVFLEGGPWAQELAADGFHVEIIPAGRLRQPHRVLATVARIAGTIRRRKPDLILNWLPKMHLYAAPAALLAGAGRRSIWWQHGLPSDEWVDRLATKLPTLAVGCSSHASARAQGRLRPARPTFVVFPGARAPERTAERPPLQLPSGVPVVGLVGRLQPWKGQARLLQAHALLRRRGHELHTVLVGGDAHGLSPQYASSLAGLISSLGLDDAVTMTGQVPDAGPYIDQLDVLVNASEAEPFGIVLLEGMARGIPVVAVNSAGPAEIVEDGRTGVLAATGDPEALASAIEPLLGSARLRHELGQAGAARFVRDFTDQAMCDRFFAALEGIARRKDVKA